MRTFSAEHTRALLMLLLANFFWGLSFPLVKGIVTLHEKLIPGASAWFSIVNTLAPRFVLATAILVALRPTSCWRATAQEWKQGVILGLFAAGGMLCQNDGLKYTEASTSAFLTQLYAILIPVWVALRAQRNPGALVWTCCVLVLAGVSILGQFNPLHLIGSGESRFGRGEWETLLASLFFMGQILTLGQKDYDGNRPLQITFITFLVQGVIFAGLATAIAPSSAALLVPWTSPPWLILTFTLAVGCTLIAYSIMNAWQPKISTTEAGLIYCIEPIFGSAIALFFPGVLTAWIGIHYLNETATWTLLVGGSLITIANVLLQLNSPLKE